MPGGVTNCFGLHFGGHLGSVVVFGSTAGNKVAASVCGPEHADKVAILVRGATEDWADPPRTSADGRTHTGSAASFLIARACDMMAAKGKPIIVAYSDPAGNEKGQIYSAVNFVYGGMTKGTEDYIDANGKRNNTRQIHGLTRDRRNGELNYSRTRAQQKGRIDRSARSACICRESPSESFLCKLQADDRVQRPSETRCWTAVQWSSWLAPQEAIR